MVDISVNIRGPRSLAESVREALEGAAHTLQDLTLGNDGLGDKLTTYMQNPDILNAIGLLNFISIQPLWATSNDVKGCVCTFFVICVQGIHATPMGHV